LTFDCERAAKANNLVARDGKWQVALEPGAVTYRPIEKPEYKIAM